MAKRDSFLKFVVKANYEEKSVCAYEDGDETFHTIKYEKDDDEASVFHVFKNAYVEVYKCFPNEEGIRKEFEKVKEANKEAHNSLKDSFKEFTTLPEIKLEKSKIEFSEEKILGELDLSKEEYSFLANKESHTFGGRGNFLITYNGKDFLGVVTSSEHFIWSQLRSEYHPREVQGSTYIDKYGLPEELYNLLYDLFQASLEELL
jgi:hypothetical protein|nr:MAG TPA: hypothetical protein [Caudoviricetes sp.]